MIHVDMDYFYAQIEEVRKPELKGKIVAVCVLRGRTQDSGVISTVNYEGRKAGIKSGMPIVNAKKLAPQGVYLSVDHEYYEQVSDQIYEIIYKNCQKIEKRSIDEWYALAEEEIETGKKIKEEILLKTKLLCTVGVAPSRLGAKMASDKA
ncbi:DNA polymerase IV, partial [Candidatus Micrarchaeota archaeon]|nr:DNA polymerase IV [Candidatus Micrarchaeota archaeon]